MTMTVIDYYHSTVRNSQGTNDFILFPFRTGFFIGYDSSGYLCVVIRSSNTGSTSLHQRTKLISIECNKKLIFTGDVSQKEETAHIIRCFSNIEKEKELFLELTEAIITEEASDEEVMEIFRSLSRFFIDKSEPSERELIGLYAELETILTFSQSLKIEDYWQSQDRMKFDFSFTDELKLEVKATTKQFRTHHFRHEQLVTEMYEIIVLSYMLRHDDEGVSLYDLINQVKPLFQRDYNKLLRLNKILKDVSEERLQELRFNPAYTSDNRKLYLANAIPKFEEATPEGVANAEYDCSLENIPELQEEEFVTIVKKALANRRSEDE